MFSRACWLFLGFSLAVCSADAEVRLMIRPDGRKVIYNVGLTRSRGSTDFGWLAKQRDRRTAYESIIQRHAAAHQIDPVFVKAVIQVESNFDPACISHKGARGLMQLMPETARRFHVSRVHDPEQNIGGGVAYLAKLMSMFPSDLPKVLAAYNAGENRVLRYRGIPPYEETMTYVRRALTVYYGRPWGGTIDIRPSGATVFPAGPTLLGRGSPKSVRTARNERPPLGSASYFQR